MHYLGRGVGSVVLAKANQSPPAAENEVESPSNEESERVVLKGVI